MGRTTPAIQNLFRMTPTVIYLWLAIFIFGAANSITRRLTELGTQHLIAGRNPISFCNVLFVGNLCALLLMILIYHHQINLRTLRQLNWQDWIFLSFVAVFGGAIAPALIFNSLAITTVTNIVLIGRLEVPLVLALSVLLLRERVNVWTVIGAVVSLIGVFATVFLQGLWEKGSSSGILTNLGPGEIMTAIAAVALAISNIIIKAKLQHIPIGFSSIFRTTIATIVFFSIAQYFYGSKHFMDAFSPFLWQWMLVYSAIIVVVGQLCWITGLQNSSASEISLAASFYPVAGILAAYFILGEAPTAAQYAGGSVILLGIILGQIGVWRQIEFEKNRIQDKKRAQRVVESSGFKGI